MLRPHQHSDLELNYLLAGTWRYLVNGRLAELPVGRLCVLWGATLHQSLDARSARMVWVTVSLEQVLGWGLPEAFVGRLLSEGLVIDPLPMADDSALLERWAADLHAGGEARQRIVLLELEARLRRLALAAEAAGERERPAEGAVVGTLAAVQRLAAYISAHYHEPVSIEAMARAVHLHPRQAMMLFRRHTGVTLHQYLTRQRVAAAQRLLMDGQRSVLDVAFASGFGSTSRFYAAFGRETGCSPGAFRRRVRQATVGNA